MTAIAIGRYSHRVSDVANPGEKYGLKSQSDTCATNAKSEISARVGGVYLLFFVFGR